MGRNIHVFQFFTVLILMLGANMVFAQQSTNPLSTLPLGTGHKSYAVDTSSDPAQPLLNDQPNGTSGSTYAWSIENMVGTYQETFPVDGRYNDVNIPTNITNDNKATIDWSNYPPGNYEVKVIESNAGCPTDEVTFTVIIEAPSSATGIPNWTNTNICKGGEVTFEISEALAGYTLHYTLTNATITQGSVLVDNDGNATITVTHDDTNVSSVVITLEKLVLNSTEILYVVPKPSATATINIIVTSPITALD